MPPKPARDAEPGDAFVLPEAWTEGARDLFREVLDVRPDLAGADLGALEQACSLASAADRLDAVALAAGYVAEGSTGQPVVHPAAVESRQTRTATSAILARLTAGAAAGALTSSQRGQRAARARWSR